MKEKQIGQLVRISLALHNINRDAEARLEISMVQYHVLASLRDIPGCSPQELADVTGMHPSTLTQSLKRLQRKGAMFVGEDPKDSRKKILGLTRRGSQLLQRFLSGIGALGDLRNIVDQASL